jgi:hypothetical protein
MDPDDEGDVDLGNGSIDVVHGDTDLSGGLSATLTHPQYADLLRALDFIKTQHQAGREAYQKQIGAPPVD